MIDPRIRVVQPPRFRGPRAEQTIAAARAVLALAGLLAIGFDPPDPARFARVAYSLQSAYVVYALILVAFVWRRRELGRLPLVTHVADIATFSVLMSVTLGPSSPFFVYYVFSLFCGALRWGWRGTLRTAIVVLAAFFAMGVSMGVTLAGGGLEPNRFIIRLADLGIVAWLLVYLGRHEAKLRDEMERLARWPARRAGDVATVTGHLLAHASSIVGAPRVAVVWGTGDEPWIYVMSWPEQSSGPTRHPPAEFEPLVAERFADAAFVAPDPEAAGVHPALRPALGDGGLASACFATDRVSGRAFFTGLHGPTSDLVPLVEIVVRELGASMGELLAQAQHQQLAIREERIRVARDLHDGVLQSMTGIRLELQGIANEHATVTPGVRDRLVSLERGLAAEQRELRLFIEGLKPLSQPAAAEGTLGRRLEDLCRRLAEEWKLPIVLRAQQLDRSLPPRLEGAVPLMVHEAVVNALKHAAPSKVTVDVAASSGTLDITVCDDGRGFAFRGRYDHGMLERQNVGPVSLRERVAGFGGLMAIDSAASGSRVEIQLPMSQEIEWRSA